MRPKILGKRQNARDILNYTKRNSGILTFSVLFLLGVLCATLLLGSADAQMRGYLLQMVDGFAQRKLISDLQVNFLSAFSSAMMFVGALFICGFCAISQPVIVAIPFFRGLGVGFSLAALYTHYGTSAISFALVYAASTLLSTAAMLLCCMEALKLSSGLFGAMRTGERAAFYPIRRYLAKFAAGIVLTVFAAILEAVLYSVFANYVVLG